MIVIPVLALVLGLLAAACSPSRRPPRDNSDTVSRRHAAVMREYEYLRLHRW